MQYQKNFFLYIILENKYKLKKLMKFDKLTKISNYHFNKI